MITETRSVVSEIWCVMITKDGVCDNRDEKCSIGDYWVCDNRDRECDNRDRVSDYKGWGV